MSGCQAAVGPTALSPFTPQILTRAGFHMSDLLMTRNFGETLRVVRTEAGLSRRELTELADVHGSHLAALERGERMPSPETLAKLSGALEMTPAELLARWYDS
jgi:ribosome-binding protein aMBF1 (putative translation factor)